MSEKIVQYPDQFPESAAHVILKGDAGDLELLTDLPEIDTAKPVIAVICHPHPLHGGTMHNKVVHMTERSLREMGAKTIRFNFRGVGKSQGEHDNGFGETTDCITIANWALSHFPDHELWLAGFSFGSYVALRASQKLPATLMVSIAPPVERYEFTELPHPDCPWLVVQGDEDEVVDPQAVFDWAENIEDHPPQLIRMQEAGHFFHRRLMDLRGVLKNGVKRAKNQQQ